MDPLTTFSLACGVIQIVAFRTKVLRTNLYLPSQPNHDELLDLGTKCSKTALELIRELQNLKETGPQRKREVLRKTMKTIWKKGAIDDIQKRLEGY